MKKLLLVLSLVLASPFLSYAGRIKGNDAGPFLLVGFFLILIGIVISIVIRSNSNVSPSKDSLKGDKKEEFLKFIRKDTGDSNLLWVSGICYLKPNRDPYYLSGGTIACTNKNIHFYGQSYDVSGKSRDLITKTRRSISVKDVKSIEKVSKGGVGWLIFAILFSIWSVSPLVMMLAGGFFVPAYFFTFSLWGAMAIIFFTIYSIKIRKFFVIVTKFKKIGVPVSWYLSEELPTLEEKIIKQQKKLKKNKKMKKQKKSEE